jgi:hypothetical protein
MFRHLMLLITAAWLVGCAGPPRLDSTVQSHALWDLATGAPSAAPTGPQAFRFERLPSQQDGAAGEMQDELEALARQSLGTRGWTLAASDAAARWSVQVSAQTTRHSPDTWGGWRWHGRLVAGNGHLFFSPMFAMPLDPPDHQRQVSLVVRELGSGRVVYETRARHDSRWNSTPDLWQGLIDASLSDFPAPPAGTRRVQVALPH